ncbi:winged helix-turn-helix transcriptional regulator [Lentzea sp. NPDC059081]|uniref:winged helix-turn-helix transcriptional regulator n=1 Tax=Lentzea sp. NPDC059081 TaxID=3346719 RepID=UPI0036A02C2B
MRYEQLADIPCSITRPLVLLGDRWTLLILKESFAGVRRFNMFRAHLGIPRSRLQDRLTRLVEHGVLARQQADDGEHPEYRLTRKGHDLYPILMAIRDWGDTHMAPDGPPVHYRHTGCEGEAHTSLECDSCGTRLSAHDVTPEAGPGLLVHADQRIVETH